MVQVFIHDLRRNSQTFGLINTINAGKFRPWEILIPPGVGHGYKALGVEPIQLLYFTDRHYNPADELRIAYNNPAIAYPGLSDHNCCGRASRQPTALLSFVSGEPKRTRNLPEKLARGRDRLPH